jgi:formylglycine-generating enzyme required for sulfatase activity
MGLGAGDAFAHGIGLGGDRCFPLFSVCSLRSPRYHRCAVLQAPQSLVRQIRAWPRIRGRDAVTKLHQTPNWLVTDSPMSTVATVRNTMVISALLLAFVCAVGSAQVGDEALDAGVVKLKVTLYAGGGRVGSGIIVRLDTDLAYIVTAAHVVVGSRETGVVFRRHDPPVPGRVVNQEHWDEERGLALLTVSAAAARAAGAHPLPLSATPLRDKGTRVRLIGHPSQGDWLWIPGAYAGREGEILRVQPGLSEGGSGGPVLLNGRVVGIVVGELAGIAVVKSVVNIRNYLEGEGVIPASHTPVTTPVAPAPVRLTVRSNVDGGQVTIDGEPRGATPLNLDLPSGAHQVRVDKDGYEPSETQIELRGGAPRTVRAKLKKRIPRAGEVLRDCDQCPALVVIPAGEFTMGSPANEDGRYRNEGPTHKVHFVEPFAIGRHEVTVDEFRAFVDAAGYRTEAEQREGCNVWNGTQWIYDAQRNWRSPGFEQGDDHPVVCVSWNDAHAYLKWLAERSGKPYRLPSEAQWEYAARAGTKTARFWGESAKLACDYANVADQSLKVRFPDDSWSVHDCNDGFVYTAPVGSFKPNGFDLVDMLGNVWEWTEDCWNDSYKGVPADGSPRRRGDCTRPVLRGGAWYDVPQFARAATRYWDAPRIRGSNVGFRPARRY